MITEFTDKQNAYIKESYRRILDRLERARSADHATAYDMLAKVIADTKELRKVLQKSKSF